MYFRIYKIMNNKFDGVVVSIFIYLMIFDKTESQRTGDGENSISTKKCETYSSHVISYETIYSLLPNIPNTNKKISNCEYSKQQLIVDGVDAEDGEFPHMALLGWSSENNANILNWKCGGSLISEYFVLTAAHCRDKGKPPVKVRLGAHNLGRKGNSKDFNVAVMIDHPQRSKQNSYNDIALIRLKKSASPFNNAIRPACLWRSNSIPDKFIATGWGSRKNGGEPSTVLQKVELNLKSNSICKAKNPPEVKLPQGVIDTQFCAGGSHSKDTCQGDSGGPLQVSEAWNPCIFQIVGITSIGGNCGTKNAAPIYTKVSKYISWIESVVWS